MPNLVETKTNVIWWQFFDVWNLDLVPKLIQSNGLPEKTLAYVTKFEAGASSTAECIVFEAG